MIRGRIDAVVKVATTEELLRAVARFTRTETFLARFRIVMLDEAAAGQFDALRVNKKLNRMGHADLRIATIALANGATLVTRNTKDYAGVPNMKLENWAA